MAVHRLGAIVLIWILTLNMLAAWASDSCDPELNVALPRFRAALVRAHILSEAEAWAANIRPIVIKHRPASLAGRVARLNRGLESKGYLVTDPNGGALVVRIGDADRGHQIFSATRDPDATVWEGTTRVLSVVQGRWKWERTPPRTREVSELTLAYFLEEFEPALRPMLEAGTLTEKDMLTATIQLAKSGGDASDLVVLDASTGGEAATKVFVFKRGDRPTWERDYVANLAPNARLSVGPSGRGLYQRHLADGTSTTQAGWAPPLGLARQLLERVEDPALSSWMQRAPEVIDQLMLHPLAPTREELEHAKLVAGRMEHLDQNASVLLVPTFVAGERSERPLPWSTAQASWLWPNQMAKRDVIRLSDGRRFGVAEGKLGFRWLPRADAFERLMAAARRR